MAIDFKSLFTGGSGLLGMSITVFVYGFLAIVIFGVFGYMWYNNKKWYLKVEFKIPRSDGRMVNSEWGKGLYNAKRGVVFVKRRKLPKIAMKPFDVKRYLQGTSTLTVVQTGISEYKPVLPESYTEMIDDITGEEALLMNMKIDLSESKAWRSQFEREAKNAFSIESLIAQFLPYIGWGLILFLNFLGFSILYTRIST